MARLMQVELPNGKRLLFGSLDIGGLQEVSLASTLPQVAAGQFENALGTLGDLVGLLEKHVGSLAKKPSTVEIEFRASLTGKCDLWVVSGEGEAEFKLTLKWESGPSSQG